MTDPIVILLVEDEAAHTEAIRRAFEAAGAETEIQVARSLREYRAAVAARPPDIALIDLNLPDGRALEVLTFPPVAGPFPVLIMTCYGNEQIAVEAMKAGALDYLVKSPEAFADMPRTVARALREWNLLRERKRAEEGLRVLSIRQKAILAAVPDIIVEVDCNKIFTWANQAGLEFYGSDVIGKEAAYYFEGEQDTYGVVQPLFAGDENVIYVESWQRRKDRQKRLLAWWCRVLKDESGRVTGALSSARDITDLKRAEEALRESEARLRLLVQASNVGLWDWDLRTNTVYFSPEWKSQIGCRDDEISNRFDEWQNRVHPDDLEATLQKVRAFIDDPQGRHEVEFRFRHKDGSYRWIYTHANVIRDVAGQPVRMMGCHIDITARKRAEEALRMSEARYRSLFDNMVEGFAYCRMLLEDGRPQDFIYLEVNEAFQTLTGLKNVTGRKASEVIPGIRKSDPELLERYGRVALTGQPERFETYFASLKMWFFVSVYCPKKEHFVAVFDVITERKRAEERIRTFSQEIIAAREEERKQVSSVLHHDAGSLAVGIAAHFDAIEKDLRSGKVEEALRWLKRTRKLFDETVVRLKAVAVQLRPPELDVLGLSAALRQYFSQITERGGVRIHFRENLGRRRVSGDTATILFRVAQEALTNAIKHGHAKQVDVSLRALKKEVRLTVRDNGKGFNPAEHWARATSQMGLRVMREMAALAGGAFGVDSGRGKGTTVRVSLPLENRL